MARKDSLIKSKSIYTIRGRHLPTNDGRVIFENDHSTIIRDDGIYNEEMPLFSDSNFKFKIRVGNNGRKKHSRGGWVNVNDETNVWTLDNMPEQTISDESKIVLKPNYSYLSDFAYYGSAREMIKATVNDVIMRYPGGISFYRGDTAPVVRYGGRNYYLVSNEFDIDFWTPIGLSQEGLSNPMRVLSASYMNYEDKNGNDIGLKICLTGYCYNSIIGKVSFGNVDYSRTPSRNDDEDEVLSFAKGGDNDVVLRGGSDSTPGATVRAIIVNTYLSGSPLNNVGVSVICEGVSAEGDGDDNARPITHTFSGKSMTDGTFNVSKSDMQSIFGNLVVDCTIVSEYGNNAKRNYCTYMGSAVTVDVEFADITDGDGYEYLTLTVMDSVSGSAISNAYVVFSAKTSNNAEFYTNPMLTNQNGLVCVSTDLYDNDWAYKGAFQPQNATISAWTAYAYKSGYTDGCYNCSTWNDLKSTKSGKLYLDQSNSYGNIDLDACVYENDTSTPIPDVQVVFIVGLSNGKTAISTTHLTGRIGCSSVNLSDSIWTIDGVSGQTATNGVNWSFEATWGNRTGTSTTLAIKQSNVPHDNSNTFVFVTGGGNTDLTSDLTANIFLGNGNSYPLPYLNVTFHVKIKNDGYAVHTSTTNSGGTAVASLSNDVWRLNGSTYNIPTPSADMDWYVTFNLLGTGFESEEPFFNVISGSTQDVHATNHKFSTLVYEVDSENVMSAFCRNANVVENFESRKNGVSSYWEFSGVTDVNGKFVLYLSDLFGRIKDAECELVKMKSTASNSIDSTSSNYETIDFSQKEYTITLYLNAEPVAPPIEGYDLTIHTKFNNGDVIPSVPVIFSAHTSDGGWFRSNVHYTNSEGVTTMNSDGEWLNSNGNRASGVSHNTIYQWTASATYSGNTNNCGILDTKHLDETIYFEKGGVTPPPQPTEYLTITVVDENNSPLRNASVVFSAKTSNSYGFHTSPKTTNSNGVVTVNFSLEGEEWIANGMFDTQNQNIAWWTAFASKDGYTDGCFNCTGTWNNDKVRSGTIILEEDVTINDTLNAYVYKNDNSHGIGGARVTFNVKTEKNLIATSGPYTTDSNGYAGVKLSDPVWYYNGLQNVRIVDGASWSFSCSCEYGEEVSTEKRISLTNINVNNVIYTVEDPPSPPIGDLIAHIYLDNTSIPISNLRVTFHYDTGKGYATHTSVSDSTGTAVASLSNDEWIIDGHTYSLPQPLVTTKWYVTFTFLGIEFTTEEPYYLVIGENERDEIITNFGFNTVVYEVDHNNSTSALCQGAIVNATVDSELNNIISHWSFNGVTSQEGSYKFTLVDLYSRLRNPEYNLMKWKSSASNSISSDESDYIVIDFRMRETRITLYLDKEEEPQPDLELIIHTEYTSGGVIQNVPVIFNAHTSTGWYKSIMHLTDVNGITTMALNDTWYNSNGQGAPDVNQNTIFEWRASATYNDETKYCHVNSMKKLEDWIFFEKKEEDFNFITIRTLLRNGSSTTRLSNIEVTASTWSSTLSATLNVDTFIDFTGRTNGSGEFYVTLYELQNTYGGYIDEIYCGAFGVRNGVYKTIEARRVNRSNYDSTDGGIFELVFEEDTTDLDLTVQTCYLDNNEPIPNLEVVFCGYTKSTGRWYSNIEHTNYQGFATMAATGPWTLNGQSVSFAPGEIIKWTAYATCGNDTNGGEEKILNKINPDVFYKIYFERGEPQQPVWRGLKVITISGYTGWANNAYLNGQSAVIRVKNSKDQVYSFNGTTTGNGEFAVSYDEIRNTVSGDIFRWKGEATYNGPNNVSSPHQESEWMGFSSTYAEKYPSVTFYFYESGGPINPTGELIATAYTRTQGGSLSTLPGVECTFIICVSKDCSKYKKTAITNSEGVAYVNINSSGWAHIEGSGSSDKRYVDTWGVTGTTGGHSYTGQDSSAPNRCGCPIVIENDNNDVIVIPKTCNWTRICVYTMYCKNNSSNGVNGVPVVIKGITANGTQFVVNGLTSTQIHPTYGEERDGLFFGSNSDRWTKVGGIASDTIEDVTGFTVSASHNGEVVTQAKLATQVTADGTIYFVMCFKNSGPPPMPNFCDDITGTWFYVYLDGDGKMRLLTTEMVNYDDLTIIRPKLKYRNEFWDTLDDFERVLLNRDTKPVYKAKFNTPYKINEITFYRPELYVWPTIDGTTPDVTTIEFNGYLSSLLKLADYHDNFDSDNIWRMMTHESLKNLDWTFRRQLGEEYDSIELDASKFKSMLMIQARLYDDLVRYADNIKHTNEVTYDEKNNVPDYFVTDKLDLNGWISPNVAPFLSGSSDVIYVDTESRGKTPSEVNISFMKRLLLNTTYIQSLRGTRRGIEAILGMFGYNEVSGTTNVPGQYNITEYVAVANEFPKYSDMLDLMTQTGEYFGEVEVWSEMGTELDPYPVAIVSPSDTSEYEDYYLIPWFNKNRKYHGDMYFQEKGGWGRVKTKKINLSITSATSISENTNINLFSETEPYLKFVNTIDDLTSIPSIDLYENMICYVTDISDIYIKYKEEPSGNGGGGGGAVPHGGQEEEEDPNTIDDRASDNQQEHNESNVHVGHKDYSHYFVLVNKSLSNFAGFVDNERYYCYGWRNIRLREFQGTEPTTDDGLRVLYLESIISNEEGNNPHVGYGFYDEGASYVERFNRLFGYNIESGMYDNLKNGSQEDREIYRNLMSFGFDVDNMIPNNKKCFYFEDGDFEIITRAAISQESIINESQNWWTSNEYTLMPIGDVDDYSNVDTEYYNAFVNPEGGSGRDEAAANSIINIKNLTINFGTANNKYFEQYIKDVVLVYLQEMIPSTTILRYTFNGRVPTPIVPVTPSEPNVYVDKIVGDLATVEGGDTYLVENNNVTTR